MQTITNPYYSLLTPEQALRTANRIKGNAQATDNSKNDRDPASDEVLIRRGTPGPNLTVEDLAYSKEAQKAQLTLTTYRNDGETAGQRESLTLSVNSKGETVLAQRVDLDPGDGVQERFHEYIITGFHF
jgi:hypothetical protein